MPTALNEQATNPAESGLIESAARELYQTAALLLGNESEALSLVEETVASVDMDPCADGAAAREAASRDLIERALAHIAVRWPAQMRPDTFRELDGCVDTDDLSAAGITRQQLDELLSGSGRQRMRGWLEGLSPVERVVFVLRAVLGRSGTESASLLRQAAGGAWTDVQVGGAFRSALCSLASSLAHAAAH